MSAGDNLSPPQFHGARTQINDTHVRPPSVTGASSSSSSGYSSGHGKPSHKELAFATPTEHVAWLYAHATSVAKDHPTNNDPDPKYRSRVYAVAPSADQHTDFPGDDEIKSATGYKIMGVHDAAPGATGTFPTHNWNAFKARKSGHPLVSHEDKNHSYMEVDHPVPDNVRPEKHVEVPGQMNLITGKTIEEHKEYENTPGVMLHMGKQFSPGDITNFHKDPTVSTIRAKKQYHRADETLGTVH
jgi:hypothetical protein